MSKQAFATSYACVMPSKLLGFNSELGLFGHLAAYFSQGNSPWSSALMITGIPT